jgi:hypothetical protein
VRSALPVLWIVSVWSPGAALPQPSLPKSTLSDESDAFGPEGAASGVLPEPLPPQADRVQASKANERLSMVFLL